jgi:hypothetical protein
MMAPENQRGEAESDPGIQAVRNVRETISAECGNDPQRLIAYYMKQQEQMPYPPVAAAK